MDKYCQNYDCGMIGECTDTDNTACKKYLSKPKESAWKMFRKLSCKKGFHEKMDKWLEEHKYQPNSLWLIIHYTEQEAIKIMKEIQEEMDGCRNRKDTKNI